jgi:uncharacterized protein (DUF58 family)
VKALDPHVLARLRNLALKARSVVDGVMVGIHPSRARGFSSEFQGHREYAGGDDIRYVDWKAFGKFDRYFIKEYQETTNLKAHLVVDGSGSMAYGSKEETKFDYAATLAASLAYLLLRQQDAVGIATFSDKINTIVPPKATQSHLFAILEVLRQRKPAGETSAGTILQELAGGLGRKGLVILISDLLDEPHQVMKGLKQLRSRGHDVMVFHVLHHDEIQFPFERPTLFIDMEEDLRLRADPKAVREAYLRTLSEMMKQYKDGCANNLIDYALFETTESLDLPLVRYLTWRARLRAGPRAVA